MSSSIVHRRVAQTLACAVFLASVSGCVKPPPAAPPPPIAAGAVGPADGPPICPGDPRC